MEDMVARWLAANRAAIASGDWQPLADFYTDDAVYSWNNGPHHEFVARGKTEIRAWAFGTEMAGLEGWGYPYVRTLIDDQKGEVVGFWRQVAPVADAAGRPYEIAGTGGSWFRYAGNQRWAWQRDFFDIGNAGTTFLTMAGDGKLSDVMQERMKKGATMPGWVKRTTFDWYATLADPEA
jgi:ketosteroid isomerase-like protein